MALAPVDYLLIGHVTRDLLPGGAATLGGTVAYAALTAAALGRSVGIVTRAATEAEVAPLRAVAQVLRLPADATATFENLDTPAGREQRVHAVAPPLLLEHIPPAWRSAALIHIGPVIDACDPGLVAAFADRAFVGVTPQGWLRGVDRVGRIYPQPWDAAPTVLPQASAVIVSITDLPGDWATATAWAMQTRLLVVTEGRRGGTLFGEGQRSPYPASAAPEVDATGAGDIFAAACFVALTEGASPYAAVTFAACIAGHSVRRAGLASAPRREEIAQCRRAVPIDSHYSQQHKA